MRLWLLNNESIGSSRELRIIIKSRLEARVTYQAVPLDQAAQA